MFILSPKKVGGEDETLFILCGYNNMDATMNADFTIEELDLIHISLITRQRVIRDRRIPNAIDIERKNALIVEANALANLRSKVCAAKLSKELGFDITNIPQYPV